MSLQLFPKTRSDSTYVVFILQLTQIKYTQILRNLCTILCIIVGIGVSTPPPPPTQKAPPSFSPTPLCNLKISQPPLFFQAPP